MSPAAGGQCVNADPSGVLTGIRGDLELTVDPQDPQEHLILTTNTNDGAANVVIARLDGRTGQLLNEAPTTIADNFFGQAVINGPDFVKKPTGELGIIYAGSGGVHAVFRDAQPSMWSDFIFDVNGAAIASDSPPALSNTSDGAYPKGGDTLGQYTYGQKLGDCVGLCYAALNMGVTTDVVTAAATRGYTATAATPSPRDGYLYFSACDVRNVCGLFEGLIDHAGGFVNGTLQKIGSIDVPVVGENLRAARHPVTGSTVIFSSGTRNFGSGNTVDVWEQAASGGKLTRIRQVPVYKSVHYRAEANETEVVLHYTIPDNLFQGSYTIPVTAVGNILVVGQNKQQSIHGVGSEFNWVPGANRWALFYSENGQGLHRCWVNP